MLLIGFITQMSLRLGARTGRAAAQAIRLWRHRRAVTDLSQLNAAQLKDIGLCRSDIDSALAMPWHRDPSQVLALRAARPFDAEWTRDAARFTPMRGPKPAAGLDEPPKRPQITPSRMPREA